MSVDFEIPTIQIEVGKGNFVVRGLNSEDIVFLSTTYWDDAIKLVTEYGKKHKKGGVPNIQIFDLLIDLAKMFPSLSAEIISRAADSPESMNKFRQLSFVKQVEALQAIAKLSVEDGHEIKKWAAGLVSLLETNGLKLGPLSSKLQTIMRGSANQSAT